ncbi:MAG: DUF421 domain-containing protein [Nocardioidaceae bacterium]
MWHAIFVLQLPVLEKVLRTVLVYATILVLFRLAGKRGLANLTTLDLTVYLLLSNVVQNALIGNDESLTGGVVGAVTLVAVNAGLNHGLSRSSRLAHVVEGRATPVIEDGHVVQRALRRLALRPAELDHAVRLQNGDDVSEIQSGRLEPGGQLVLTLKPQEQNATKADVDNLHSELARVHATLAQILDRRA